MIRGAGILFIAPDGAALFIKRGSGGDHPGEWCFPGGTTEGEESADDTAKRETVEEIGFLPDGERQLWARRIATIDGLPRSYQDGGSPLPVTMPAPGAPATAWPAATAIGDGVDFTTFLQRVKEKFTPTLNAEHTGFAWAPVEAPPEPLHPGCRIALAKLTMDELGIAQAMSTGELASPQRYKNVTLFDLRITGTGLAYRRAINEHVYRRPENYLTPEFLARCNGLPVVMMHPASKVLNSKEFSDRIVGTMLLPYIKGEEVWGIAKVYDTAAIDLMETMPMSTSPGVVLGGAGEQDIKVQREDGSTLLIEGKPSLLDHLAICERGVWDKGGEPTGVNSEIREDADMTEEEIKAKKDADDKAAKEKADAEATEAKVKADADAGQKLDKMLSCLDSLSKRMDSFDAKEKEKADAEAKQKADAEEASRQAGDPEQIAADKAKKDAEEDEARKAKEKADADEKAKLKADSDDIRGMLTKLAASIPKTMAEPDYAAMADEQARADAVFSAFGERAAPPLRGEDLPAYRRRLAGGLKSHSKSWGKVDLTGLPDPAFDIAADQIYADAMEAARHPASLPDGQLRAITRRNDTGHTVTTFVGNRTFVAGLARPARQVVHLGMGDRRAS